MYESFGGGRRRQGIYALALLQLPSMVNKRWNERICCCSWSKRRSSFFFHHEFPSSPRIEARSRRRCRRAAGHHRTLPLIPRLVWSELESRRAERAHTHTQTGKEKGGDWTTRQLSAGCVSFRKDHEALLFLTNIWQWSYFHQQPLQPRRCLGLRWGCRPDIRVRLPGRRV